MTSILPNPRQVTKNLNEYLGEVHAEVNHAFESVRRSPEYRNIYKIAVAAHGSLRRIRVKRNESIQAAAAITRRVPMLVALGQLGLTYVELRRFVELICWFVYFRHHPVEWDEFLAGTTKGLSTQMDDPIAYCARRETSFYLRYAKSLFRPEVSGVCAPAVRVLAEQYTTLHRFAHAATAAASRVSWLRLPTDPMSRKNLSDLARKQRKVFSSGCIAAFGVVPNALGRLDAVERAWFDWLIGAENSKGLRGSEFGMTL